MPLRSNLLEVPLLLAGVPGAVRDWLRQAGVPTAPFRPERNVLGALHRPRGRFVLFDSRIVSGRAEAEAARAYALDPIDLAPLVQRAAERAAADNGPGHPLATPPDPAPAHFLEELKKSLERRGGLWARLADYPSPYQSVVCFGAAVDTGVDRLLDQFAPLPEPHGAPAALPLGAPAGDTTIFYREADVRERLAPAEWIRRRYVCGLPFRADAELHGTAGNSGASLFEPYPLLWRTSPDVFLRWWRFRKQLEIRLQCVGSGYRIECSGKMGGFLPMLELWRGRHMASIPLEPGIALVRTDGLLFQRQNFRHPAGFASRWAENRRWAENGRFQELQTA